MKKIKTFLESIEDDWNDDFQEEYGYYDDNDTPPYEDDYYEDETDVDDGMEHILYLLRSTLRNKGIIDCFVTSRDYDISISIVITGSKKLSDISHIFESINSIRTDIIPQYDSLFDMYYTKANDTILEFNFYLNEGLGDESEDYDVEEE